VFRLTIRDMLWLTVVAALFIGWMLDRSAVQGERVKMQEEIAAERESLAIEHKMAKIRELEAQAQSAQLMKAMDQVKARAAAKQPN